MNEITEKLIRDLAEKFGTTAQHLWEVMVRQAPISAWINVLHTGVLVIISSIAVYTAARWCKFCWERKTNRQRYNEWESDVSPVLASIAVSVAIVALTITTIVLLAAAGDLVTALYNPEYWALSKFLPRR